MPRNEAFHVGNVATWFQAQDAWADFSKIRQRLTAAKIKAARAALERVHA